MPSAAGTDAMLEQLDEATRALVRVAAALAGGSEDTVRAALAAAAETTPHAWIEEVLLQTYLFAGFPRALNGTREWRRIAPRPVPDAPAVPPERWRPDGERTCARVYGTMYERLRSNVRALHPALDDWMVEEGYGKVLSRPGLDLPRRELCIVAACAATGQDRQLLSHLHGARNVGLPATVIGEALAALDVLVPPRLLDRATRLWQKIGNDVH